MTVLYSLIHDFLNWRTGRLDPSVAQIAKKSGLCERTVHSALKRLRLVGLINWTRRCEEDIGEDGRYRLKQRTNAYAIEPPSSWSGYRDDEPPVPTPDVLGKPPPEPEILERAAADLAAGDRSQVYTSLTLDPKDKLAIALAEWGRTLGHI